MPPSLSMSTICDTCIVRLPCCVSATGLRGAIRYIAGVFAPFEIQLVNRASRTISLLHIELAFCEMQPNGMDLVDGRHLKARIHTLNYIIMFCSSPLHSAEADAEIP